MKNKRPYARFTCSENHLRRAFPAERSLSPPGYRALVIRQGRRRGHAGLALEVADLHLVRAQREVLPALVEGHAVHLAADTLGPFGVFGVTFEFDCCGTASKCVFFRH